jgi:class 3 adenylate cyclase/tetratricopeptide (TPR) repeat protein
VPEERRLLTVVFADVVGSTALGEQFDAEDIRAMLAGYYAIAKDVVATYDGTLEKFIGDAVMGVFGLPQAHGDDAERALSASLELRDRVRADPNLSDLKLRFGVCTGEVVATREPGADFLVTGEAVNIAARLQQAAEPWAILAAERTVASVTGSFDIGPALEIEAKGKSSAITAHQVLSKLPRHVGIRAPKASMRGRQDELDQLSLAGRRAFRDRRPAFVTIIAPAGTGKTRLLEEFLSRELPAIAPNALIAYAQCLPYGTQLTYWPLRQMLFSLIAIPEEAGAGEIRARLAGWLDEPRFADLIATSIGYGVGDAPDRADVFAAWRFALEKASNVQPLALVFEDLHWSSESLLDLVDFVMQSHGAAAILMLALSRPELLDRRSSWGGGRRNFSNLVLEPLAHADMRSLVRDLLGDASDQTVDAVVATAGGNPFYAEELARSVSGRGAVGHLPDTVQASIQARLDLLPAEERRLLQLGSIFGRTFRISGVSALDTELGSRIDVVCESLLARDVVKRDDSDHLSFGHILIRDVTYQAMTRAERAQLHAAAGRWLESRAVGREAAVAELVAFHYREAISLLGRQRPSGFDANDVMRRAVQWLSRAGDAAAAAGADLEASRHFRAAIDLADEHELPELYERLGDVLQLSQGSIDAYAKALELSRQARRPAVTELRVLSGLLMCVMRWAEGPGRFPLAAVEQMRVDGRALAAEVNDAHALAKFFAADACHPFHVGREGGEVTPDMIDEAEASARRALDLAERAGDWNTWSAAIDGITGCHIERHQWSAARDAAQMRVNRQDDLRVLERMDAYHMVTQASICMGDLENAERSLKGSTALLDKAQNPTVIVGLLSDRMRVLLLLGRWDEVVQLGDQSLRVWTESHEVAIGPARIGFVSGLDVARARRDASRATQFQEALIKLAANRPSGPVLRAYAGSDTAELERAVLDSVNFASERIDLIERLLSVLADRKWSASRSTVEGVTHYADRWYVPLLKAQLMRLVGDFAGAAEIFKASGALPYLARARIELAESRGVAPDPESVAFLQTLGDIEYLESHFLPLRSV